MFFSFDGVDGAGKTTQIDLFCQWLTEQGHDLLTCRDPGSTKLGEMLRDILLQSESVPIDRRTEMLLYMTARTQLVEEVLRPALDAGKTVVSDRYLLANIVYQGHAGGLDLESVRQVGEIAIAGIRPRLTFLLDLDPKVSLERIQRTHDRIESQGLAYMEKVRAGFLAEAALHPEEIIVVDASQAVEAIHAEIRVAAERVLQNKTEIPNPKSQI